MNKGVFALGLTLTLMGAGCTSSHPRLPASPDLRITSPASGREIAESEIQIAGTSNMPAVYINGDMHIVTEGRFVVPVQLRVGVNTFTLIAGNGYTTSSLPLSVIRTTSTSQ